VDAGTVYGLRIGLIFAGILVISVAILLLFLSSVQGRGKSQSRTEATRIALFAIILAF
jgi:hypothetical protein